MCRWCGKFSFLDDLEMHDVLDNDEKFEEWKAKTTIYIKDEPLHFETKEDFDSLGTVLNCINLTNLNLTNVTNF